MRSYIFETLGSMLVGVYNPNGGFRQRFRRGCERAFPQTTSGTTRLLYELLRCGLYHEGFIKPGVIIAGIDTAASESNGALIVNPERLLHETEKAFAAYIQELRSNPEMKAKFDQYLEQQREKFRKSGRVVTVSADLGTTTVSPLATATILEMPTR